MVQHPKLTPFSPPSEGEKRARGKRGRDRGGSKFNLSDNLSVEKTGPATGFEIFQTPSIEPQRQQGAKIALIDWH